MSDEVDIAVVCDSGLGDVESRTGDQSDSSDERLNKNISQIEALLKRINDENKKTREILERIDKGEFKKEKKATDIKSFVVKTRTVEMESSVKKDETDDEA